MFEESLKHDFPANDVVPLGQNGHMMLKLAL